MRAVYVIAEEGVDVCKIGLATDPRKRISSLQVGHSRQLRLAGAWQTDGAEILEKAVHEDLAAHRMVGEWFGVSPFDAAFAVGAASARLGLKAERIDVSAFRLILLPPKRCPGVPIRSSRADAPKLSSTTATSPLQAWREAAGLTQRQLAIAVGTSHSTLSRAEAGLHRPNGRLTKRLTQETGLTAADILEPWVRLAADSEAEAA